jgi:hypothetical protein
MHIILNKIIIFYIWRKAHKIPETAKACIVTELLIEVENKYFITI